MSSVKYRFSSTTLVPLFLINDLVGNSAKTNWLLLRSVELGCDLVLGLLYQDGTHEGSQLLTFCLTKKSN